MVDPDKIRTRLEHASESLRRLQVIRSRGRDAFLSSWENRDIAERNLQTLIQAVMDVGNHLVTDTGLGAPVRYTDILDKLASSGIISDDLASRLVPVFGMRNVLVHEYVKLDMERLWSAVEDTSALEEFTKNVATRFLGEAH